MSQTVSRHRKLPDYDDPQPAQARHRKQLTAIALGRRARRTTLIVGAATAAAAVVAAVVVGVPALRDGSAGASGQAAVGQVTDSLSRSVIGSVGNAMSKSPLADAAGSTALGTASAKKRAGNSVAAKPGTTKSATRGAAKNSAKAPAATARHRAAAQNALTAVYLNPLRKVSGLQAQRIDMGADFGGTGPVYAIGDAVITNAIGNSPGWPGGGWITYQLTDGPAKGLVVYLAEDVTPTVQVGQQVTPHTVIANMYNGGAGIETGWAMPDSSSAESQLPAAGGISGNGPFPTAVGINFEHMMEALGVPASPFNANAAPYGILPPNYPASYTSLTANG